MISVLTLVRLAHGPCLFKSEVTRTNDSHKSFTFEFIYFYKFYSALDSEYEPPSDVLAHTVDNLWIKVYGPKSMCVCVSVCAGLTCSFGFRAGTGWHTRSCAEPLTQVR